MRRDFRKKSKMQNDKIIIYSVAGVLVLLTIVFALLMYGNSMNNEVRSSQLSSEQIANIMNNEENTESASSNMGKSVDEQSEKLNQTLTNSSTSLENANVGIESNTTANSEGKTQDTTNSGTGTNTSSIDSKSTQGLEANSDKTKTNTASTSSNNNENQKPKQELSFQMPVEGDIVSEFAQDNLIFSETLQEWVTHNGIDIKAEKATVVQAAEDGTIKSIKNDPRYGLTIVIEHENGFQTVYANLLSSEFVTEGEKVEKGQAIGTVGNTAVFESADEPHLHFEIIKDSVQVDPSIFVK